VRDVQQPFADVRPEPGGFSLPEIKWRELLFLEVLALDGDAYVRNPQRPVPSFRIPGLFPPGARFRVEPAAEARVVLVRLDAPLHVLPPDGVAIDDAVAICHTLERADALLAGACVEAGRRLSLAADVLHVAGGCAAFLGAASPLTHAIGLGIAEPCGAAEIAAVEAFYAARGAGCSIELSPYADPALLPLLRERGYVLAGVDTVLTRDLAGPLPARAAPQGAALRWSNAREGALWAAVVARGFGLGDAPAPEHLAIGRVLFEATGALFADALGQPAACAAVSVHEGVAIFLADATLPEHRGRGLQTALIAERLHTAAGEGCTRALAFTQPGSASERHYRRAGFVVACTRATLVRDAHVPAA
jgi:GNAT superfamily N-acetyltransferase